MLWPVLAEVAIKGSSDFGEAEGGWHKSHLLPTNIVSAISLELSWIYLSQRSMLLSDSASFRSYTKMTPIAFL